MSPNVQIDSLPADPSGIELTYTRRHLLSVESAQDIAEHWVLSADIRDWFSEKQPDVVSHVGDIDIWIAEASSGYNPIELLDETEWAVSQVAQAIFDVDTGDFRIDLMDRFDAVGSGLLVLNKVRLTPEWRGYGIGVALAGVAIQQLSRGCAYAATLPAPIPDVPPVLPVPENEWNAGVAALARTWGKLGFEPYRNGIHVLALGYTRFSDVCSELMGKVLRREF